jgi:hypothetical protein
VLVHVLSAPGNRGARQRGLRLPKRTNGTQPRSVRPSCSVQPARRAANSGSFCCRLAFIFQLPTTSLPRIVPWPQHARVRTRRA